MMPKLRVMALGFVLVAFLLVGGVMGADIAATQAGATITLYHSNSVVNYIDNVDGQQLISYAMVDGQLFNPSYVGPTALSDVWGSGTNTTNSDILMTHILNGKGGLKGTIVEKSPHTLQWQISIPASSQIIPYAGGYRIIGTDANSESELNDAAHGGIPAGITIPAPTASDANGTVNVWYTYNTTTNIITLNIGNEASGAPTLYPLTIDPSYYLSAYQTYLKIELNENSSTMTRDDMNMGTWTGTGLTFSSVIYPSTIITSTGSAYFNSAVSGTYRLVPSGNAANYTSGTNAMTYVSWVYPTTSSEGDVVDFRTNSGATQLAYTVFTSGLTPSVYLNAGTLVTGNQSFTLNAWNQYVLERNTTTNTVYQWINGVPAGQAAESASDSLIGGAGAPTIGNQQTPGATMAWVGYQSSIAYWNGAAIPIANLYPQHYQPGQITSAAAFSSTPTQGTAPLSVSFADLSSGNPSTWVWNYTPYINGVQQTSTQTTFATTQNPSYTFGTAGVNTEYYINLTVTGPQIANGWVNTTAIVPSFINNETNPNLIGGVLAILFTDTSAPTPVGWSWSFGDGSYSNSQNPVHTYTSPNSAYTVTENVTDGFNTYTKTSQTLPVYIGVPYASFTESPTSGQAGTLVSFTDTSYRGTSSGLSYNWSFGDSVGTNPYSNTLGSTNHVYAYNGIFYPNLTISNANGTSYYVGQSITISNSGTQTYYLPVQVGLKFVDYNGAPLTGVSVVATPINFSAPAGWINSLLGINSNINIVGNSVGLSTDSLGVCAMPMVQSIEYTIAVKGTSALNPAETVNTTFTLFPVQSSYQLQLPTNLVPYALPTTQAATNQITYSITNTSGVSTQTYTTTYKDASGGTTALQLFVENTTGAWIASSNYTGSPANSETFSQSEPNLNGGTYTWGFIATQNQLGTITQSQVLNFPLFVNMMDATTGWAT